MTNCNNDLCITDGSDQIYVVDIEKWEIKNIVSVTNKSGYSIPKLNEIEYVDGFIYANVFYSNSIYKIDLNTGNVVQTYNLLSLYQSNEEAYIGSHDKWNDIMNGIAYHSPTDSFYITGKRWNYIFQIQLD
jgi:glutaminyl-peptide cyclotransferase